MNIRKSLFGKHDLTNGCIWKTILVFCLPIFLSYLLQHFYSIADNAICGRTLSSSEIAGVGDTGSISFIFLQFAFGCTAGMSTVMSNKIGENDIDGARKAFATQIVLSVVICAAVTGISLACIDPLLKLIGVAPSENSVDIEVYTAAKTYITVICGGMAGQFFYNSVCCILRSIGDSVTPMIFLLISSVLNVAMDLIFIICFRWGVAGAAAATVISQTLSAIGCFITAFVKYRHLRPALSDFKAINLKSILTPLKQGIPLGLQFSVLAFGILTMSNGVIAFDKTPEGLMVAGTPAQIGFGAANKVIPMLMMPYAALGTAMISFCGQNHGAGDTARIKKGVLQAHIIALIYFAFALTAGLLLTINGAYQYIFLSADKITEQTIMYGNMYVYATIPPFFLVGIIYILRNSLQGIGKPLFPFLGGVAELAGRILICLFLPQIINGGPVNSEASPVSFLFLCFADAGAWLLADLILIPATIKFIILKKTAEERKNPSAL